ncbi:MAG: antitoxin Xre-like helix-turn-helix domain-containing protein [Candidatus Marinimicrobia bacterium]|nr:antitoxin Xre-like helix-turn-helix domain-containing protein [Candidatus Neomarinimicrobiota bacterium]
MVDYPTTEDQEVFREQLRVSESMGNKYVSLVGLRDYETPALVGVLQEGLAFEAFEHFAVNLGLPKDELLNLLQLPLRTLQRRKKEGVLHPDESDRLLRAARVFAHVVALFDGNYIIAREWFAKPLQALGGSSPLEFASTELGAREVEIIIGRLEHGIPL